MSEVMTMKEIEKNFDKEWVLIENPKRTKDDRLVSGILLGHSKDRHRLYKKIGKFKPKHCAVLYVGDPPKDVIYLL